MFGSHYFGQPYFGQGYAGETGIVVEFSNVIVATLADDNPTLVLLDDNVERAMTDGNPTLGLAFSG